MLYPGIKTNDLNEHTGAQIKLQIKMPEQQRSQKGGRKYQILF